MSATRLFILCVMIAFTGKILMYHQSDYILTTERALVPSYNDQNAECRVKFFKFNRTYTALNFTFISKRDFGFDIMAKVQAYKFLSNEYRFFPMTFSRNACAALQQNEFGMQNLLSCGNFSRCPFTKRAYYGCNWGPDFSKFPPYIPHGQYMLEFEFSYMSEELCTLEWYIKVVSSKLI